jgi:diaminopimelate epimerase
MKNLFLKYEALGNSYIVLDPKSFKKKLTSSLVKKICDKNFGIGSDGILYGPIFYNKKPYLRIFNPDGSEAEKSGNGIRIFAKYLFDFKYLKGEKGKIITKGGEVEVKKENKKATKITAFMGKLIFESNLIPVKGKKREVIKEKLKIKNKTFLINCVSIGNPHCVIIEKKFSKEDVLRYGPLIENHKLFPQKINVEFVKVLNRRKIEMLVWERGAGYTLACGSGASASVGVCYRLNLTDKKVKVVMEGGEAEVEVFDDLKIRLTGEVKFIASGYFDKDYFRF